MPAHDSPSGDEASTTDCPYCTATDLQDDGAPSAEYTLVGHLIHECAEVPDDVYDRMNGAHASAPE